MYRLLPVLLMLFVGGFYSCGDPAPPGDLLSFFPDSSGTHRVIAVQYNGQKRGRFALQTRTASRRSGGVGLDYMDPLHQGLLGNWQLLVDSSGIEMLLPAHEKRFRILNWPIDTKRLPDNVAAGLELSSADWQNDVRHDGRKTRSLKLTYRITAQFVVTLGLSIPEQEFELRLWLVPNYGFLRLQVGESYEELRVE